LAVREAALLEWLEQEYQLGAAASIPLLDLIQQQETISEVPTNRELLIECVAMQSCQEYFLHTPLPRAANETLARVLVERWRRLSKLKTLTIAVDLGVHAVVPFAEPLTAGDWRVALGADEFAESWQSHLHSSELLANAFGRVAQTGLMILRNPLGRKRKVGGKDWAERRLFEQIRDRAPDFLLLRQAAAEASSSFCDFATACAFVKQLTSQPIRVRHLAEPSPFGEAMLSSGFEPTAITTSNE
jgi:Lhr-like helicase